jgi:integrase
MTRSTTKTRRKHWAYSAGARGVNRVRAFRHAKTGRLYLEWSAPDAGGEMRVYRRSLPDASQDEAKAAADRLAVELLTRPALPAAAMPISRDGLTLGALLDIYNREADPARTTRKHNERAAALFVTCWGRDRKVQALAAADLETYIRARRAGIIAPNGRTGRPVRDRVLEEDLTYLRTVIRWATRKRKDDQGRWLLEVDPLGDAVAIPRERDPRRTMLPAKEVTAMMAKAWEMDRRVWLAMVLCKETGRRLKSVRQLRWGDVDLEAGTIIWRGERQKNGQTRVTPITSTLKDTLKEERRARAVIGDAWLFPTPKGDGAITREVFYKGWTAIRDALGLKSEGAAFHAFRRALASDLSTAPLAVVAELGGWKHPEVALKVYQAPNLEQQRDVLSKREQYRKGA